MYVYTYTYIHIYIYIYIVCVFFCNTNTVYLWTRYHQNGRMHAFRTHLIIVEQAESPKESRSSGRDSRFCVSSSSRCAATCSASMRRPIQAAKSVQENLTLCIAKSRGINNIDRKLFF